MIRTLAKLFSALAMLASVGLTATPAAAWNRFVSMGVAVVQPDPSCVSHIPNRAICAARATDDALVVDQFDGNSWSGWAPLAGTVTSSPSCAQAGAGKALCAARGQTGNLVYALFNGARWSALARVGSAAIASAPSCVNYAAARVLCAARGYAGGLVSVTFNGKWSAFKTNVILGTISAPGCTRDDSGAAICATLGSASNVLIARFNGAAWSSVLNLGQGGGFTAEIDCASMMSGGNINCFGRGTDSQINLNVYVGGAWALSQWEGWQGLGGLAGSKASCAALTVDQNECAILGTDSALYVGRFAPAIIGWSGWQRLGGAFIGAPSCIVLSQDNVLCAAIGINNRGVSTTGP
jgi:hypothetical protein